MNPQIVWRLRNVMADRGMFKTSDLVEPLQQAGVALSREQIFRLVTQQPKRLNIDVLAALCSILECTPDDLLAFEVVSADDVRTGTAGRATEPLGSARPIAARIRRPGQ